MNEFTRLWMAKSIAIILEAIGDTPMVARRRIVEPGMAKVHLKLERANPTGSKKDRRAPGVIEAAKRDGRLQWTLPHDR